MNRTLFLSVLSTLMLIPAGAYAVPARPGLTERHMPDGTVVKVHLSGDETGKSIFSEDGWPLIESRGTLWFAQMSSAGELEPSPYSVSSRNANTDKWLATLSFEEMESTATRRMISARQKSPIRKNPGLHYSSFPHQGEPKAIVILVEYQDVKCNVDNPGDYFYRMLNEEGFKLWGGTGSARDYFIEASSGAFRPQFDLYGPVTLPEKMAYYGGNVDGDDANPADMAVHACQILDDSVDFRQYDHDGDGLIDNVFIFYAGRGEASGGSDDTVWPHSWDVRSAYYGTDKKFVFDGVELGHYACTNEWKDSRPDGIGTFVHEFSHVLGLPDLYVTGGANTGSFTPGSFDVLDYGPYNNLSRTPPTYSAYARYAMGWTEPVPFSLPDNVELMPLLESNQTAIVKGANPNEYFLFENRQLSGWDRFIPGHGMIVWHVDFDEEVWENGGINNNPSHLRVDLIEADRITTDNSRASDTFPGTAGVTALSSATHPLYKWWDGTEVSVPISEISESKQGVVSFKVCGGLPDSDTPEPLPPSDVESYSFTATWKPVPDALKYELTVYEEMAETPFLTKTFSADTTAYVLTGLAPESLYLYCVRAWQTGKGPSPFCTPMKVTTGEATFEWMLPEACEATNLTDTGFKASWQPVDGAREYFITVFNKTDIITDDDAQSFDGGAASLPADWSCTSEITFDSPLYSGKATPSIRINAAGGHIESAVYPTDIHSLSLWHRGAGSSAGNIISIETMTDGKWRSFAEVEVTEAEGGRTDTLYAFPYGARAIRINYSSTGTKRGPVAIDDVVVRREVSFTRKPVNGIDRKSAGNSLNMSICGLDPDTEYFYSVAASDGSLMSRESAPVRVRTREKGWSGVSVIPAQETYTSEYWSLTGIPLTRPIPGQFVIVRRGSKVTKEIFRD